MFLPVSIFACFLALAGAATNVNDYKDQYCTDPRTMRKHNAYTEWADAYSCTRHRCQPGGRNLAIYTVGCKRVEAPESAIECEEVVEDTNMQFPYCCTRLRCLVVVRGEVWTRVLGQPWEILPAAPWSHMYKMKKPPPGDEPFSSKKVESGPVYELVEPEAAPSRGAGAVSGGNGGGGGERMMRASLDTGRSSPTSEVPDFAEAVRKINPAPDIVIALATNNDVKPKKAEKHSSKRSRKPSLPVLFANEDDHELVTDVEAEETTATEKAAEPASQEYTVQKKTPVKAHQVEWTDHTAKWPHSLENDNVLRASPHSDGLTTSTEERHEETKGTNLQALVDAIGTRMKDIENVVQKMSDKVHQGKKDKTDLDDLSKGFVSKVHGNSKYLHDSTTEPVYLEDNNLNGYFSDLSNGMRRAGPKEPPQQPAVYMAPVEAARRKSATAAPEGSEEDRKHKKHHGKKKHAKSGRSHKKHHKGDKRKRFNRLNSVEADRNVVSVEDSASVNHTLAERHKLSSAKERKHNSAEEHKRSSAKKYKLGIENNGKIDSTHEHTLGNVNVHKLYSTEDYKHISVSMLASRKRGTLGSDYQPKLGITKRYNLDSSEAVQYSSAKKHKLASEKRVKLGIAKELTLLTAKDYKLDSNEDHEDSNAKQHKLASEKLSKLGSAKEPKLESAKEVTLYSAEDREYSNGKKHKLSREKPSKRGSAKLHTLGSAKDYRLNSADHEYSDVKKHKHDSEKRGIAKDHHYTTAKDHNVATADEPKLVKKRRTKKRKLTSTKDNKFFSSKELHSDVEKGHELVNANKRERAEEFNHESAEEYKAKDNKYNMTRAGKIDAYPRIKLTIYNVTDVKTDGWHRRIELSIVT